MAIKAKIEHYVPRFYLSNFSIFQAKKHLLNCFDKVQGKSFRVDIANIAAERRFYDEASDVNQSVEKTLGNYESVFNAAYERLLKFKNFRVLKKAERNAIIFFIASQEVRTREFRESLKDSITQLSKHLSRENLSEDFRKQMKEAQTDESVKSLQVDILREQVPTYAAIMAKMKWVIMENRTSSPLWTSDHPVNRVNFIDHSPYGSLGLLKTGIQIHFPLNSTLVLCLCDPVTFRHFPDRLEIADPQNVVFQNSLQVNQSTRHVFSVDDNFALAERMIKDNPELRRVDRKRHDVR